MSTADPFQAANEALRRAREARGLPPEDDQDVESSLDPLQSAREALEHAESALASTKRPDPPEKRLRDALAQAELRRLRSSSEETG